MVGRCGEMCLFVLFRLFWYVRGKDRPTERLADDKIFDHDCRVGSAHFTNELFVLSDTCPTPVERHGVSFVL